MIVVSLVISVRMTALVVRMKMKKMTIWMTVIQIFILMPEVSKIASLVKMLPMEVCTSDLKL